MWALVLLAVLVGCDAGYFDGRKLVVICGQSNAVGTGRVRFLDPQAAELAEPYPAVPFASNTGDDRDPPEVRDYPMEPLGARMGRAELGFGIELTLGRALDDARHDEWAIAKFGRSSTALAIEWDPSGTYPPMDPNGQNLFEQFVAYVAAQAEVMEAEVAAFIWIQGESDAPTGYAARNYGRRLRVFVDLLRQQFPVPFIYQQLNAAAPYEFTAELRAEQERVQSDWMILENTDDGYAFPLRADLVHYDESALLTLGEVYAERVLALTR